MLFLRINRTFGHLLFAVGKYVKSPEIITDVAKMAIAYFTVVKLLKTIAKTFPRLDIGIIMFV